MKITHLKLFQSVKVTVEGTYFTDSEYDIQLQDNIFRIQDIKSNVVSYTSLFNACWWRIDEQVNISGEKETGSTVPATKGNRKVKG